MVATATAPKPSTKGPTKTPQASTSGASAADPIVDMLNRYGFKRKLVKISLSEINRKKSELNQARIDKPIDEDQVIMYATQMEAGDQFPPIVVYKAGNQYIVMDGNHRVAARFLSRFEDIDAYVVDDPSPAQVRSYTYEANTKHGKPTSMDDRLQQAIHLVDSEVPVAEAASRLGIPASTLRSSIDQYQAEKRFQRIGIRKFDALNATAKRKLDSIHSDVVLKAAAELALEARLSSNDLSTLVKDLNGIRTEREAVNFVKSTRDRLAATIKATAGGRIPVPTSVMTFSRVTSTLNRMDPTKLLDNLSGLPTDVRAQHRAAAVDAMDRLMDVIRGIDRAGAA